MRFDSLGIVINIIFSALNSLASVKMTGSDYSITGIPHSALILTRYLDLKSVTDQTRFTHEGGMDWKYSDTFQIIGVTLLTSGII